MVLTLIQFCQIWWQEICKKVNKAVVFIDNDAAECLHWNGGLMMFMSAGAVGVKQFSSFQGGNVDQKKAVFITSSPIFNQTKTILYDIIKNSNFEYCVLITAAHPSIQQFAKYGGIREGGNDMSAFHNLEEDMLQWLGNMNFTVEVFYQPLFMVPATKMLFLTPPFRNLFPLTEVDLPRVKELQHLLNRGVEAQQLDSLSTFELTSLPLEVQVSARQLVSCLHSWFTQIDVREDIYSIGAFSGLLAAQLEALPAAANRRKMAGHRASLILVDRTLDLCSATRHDSESLLDRIRAVLPTLPGHSNDVAVNMSVLCNATVRNVLDNVVLAPGCLAHQYPESCPQVLEGLVNKKQRDVMLALQGHLSSLGPNPREGAKLNPRITPQSLEKQVAAFKGCRDKIAHCSGLLQQTLAVSQTLKSPRAAQLDLMVSIEKLLLQNLASSRDGAGILPQVTQLLRTRKERGLGLVDLLSMLVYLYSLAGTDVTFPTTDQQQLQAALYEALMQDRSLMQGSLASLVGPNSDEEIVAKVASQIVTKLQCLATARKQLSKYRSMFNHPGPSQAASCSGLLQQLFTDLMDPTRPEIRDLTCKSAGLRDLLKTGFSLLLNLPRQHHPLDNPQLIVFVVGGVTAQEVRHIEERSAGQSCDVLVGATRLLTPADTVEALFLRDPLLQEM